jgi:hypothetical protein
MLYALWPVLGAAVCWAVGNWRGMAAEGAAMGLVLGPFIGPIAVLLVARYDPDSSARRREPQALPQRQP